MSRTSLLIAVAVVLATLSNAVANVLHVPSQYPTIQAAVDAAQAGDTVLVADGQWAGFITDKSITVKSESGPAACIIDRPLMSAQSLIQIMGGATAAVEGFQIVPQPTYRSTLGIVIADGAQVTISDCDIGGFWGLTQPGAVFIAGTPRARSKATFIDCTIRDSGSGDLGIGPVTGGAMLVHDADLTMIRCAIENNATVDGVAITHGTATHDAGDGAGLALIGANATLIDCIIRDNHTGAGGSDPGCDPFHQSGHGTNGGRGGGIFMQNTSATLVNTVITGNSTGSGGIGGECPPRTGGDGGDGGAIYISGGELTIINATIADNTAGIRGTGPAGDGEDGRGGGIFADDAIVKVHNTILWGNSASGTESFAAQIFGAVAEMTHNCILGLPGQFDAHGNFSLDPLFRFENGSDYRLRANSPCIDAGDNTKVPAGITTDAAGQPRFHEDPQSVNVGIGPAPIVDVGAYEFQDISCYADCNADGVLNALDFHCFIESFAAGDPRANCSGTTQAPLLNINDFICFINHFSVGCP